MNTFNNQVSLSDVHHLPGSEFHGIDDVVGNFQAEVKPVVSQECYALLKQFDSFDRSKGGVDTTLVQPTPSKPLPLNLSMEDNKWVQEFNSTRIETGSSKELPFVTSQQLNDIGAALFSPHRQSLEKSNETFESKRTDQGRWSLKTLQVLPQVGPDQANRQTMAHQTENSLIGKESYGLPEQFNDFDRSEGDINPLPTQPTPSNPLPLNLSMEDNKWVQEFNSTRIETSEEFMFPFATSQPLIDIRAEIFLPTRQQPRPAVLSSTRQVSRDRARDSRSSSRGQYASNNTTDNSNSRRRKLCGDEQLLHKRSRRELNEIEEKARAERKIVYVGGLKMNYDEHWLRDRFEKFGDIELVKIFHPKPGVGLDKYAFLYYKLKSCANDAVSMGIKDERGMQLRVAFGDRRNFCRSDYDDEPVQEELGFDELLKQLKESQVKGNSSND